MVEELRFACFCRQVQVFSCHIPVVEENLAVTKPGCRSCGGKEVGGGAEKSHKNYLRAGKNACERQEKLIPFLSSDHGNLRRVQEKRRCRHAGAGWEEGLLNRPKWR